MISYVGTVVTSSFEKIIEHWYKSVHLCRTTLIQLPEATLLQVVTKDDLIQTNLLFHNRIKNAVLKMSTDEAICNHIQDSFPEWS